MRTTDPDPVPFQPLGQKVPAAAAPLSAPEWKQIPGAAKGVGVDPDGKLSTRIPGNEVNP